MRDTRTPLFLEVMFWSKLEDSITQEERENRHLGKTTFSIMGTALYPSELNNHKWSCYITLNNVPWLKVVLIHFTYSINLSQFKLLLYVIPLGVISNNYELHFTNTIGEQQSVGLGIPPKKQLDIHNKRQMPCWCFQFKTQSIPFSKLFANFRNKVFDSQNTNVLSPILFQYNDNTKKILNAADIMRYGHSISIEMRVYLDSPNQHMIILYKFPSQSLFISFNSPMYIKQLHI